MKIGNYKFDKITSVNETEKINKALKLYIANSDFFNLLSIEEGLGKEEITEKTVKKDFNMLPFGRNLNSKSYCLIMNEQNEDIGIIDILKDYPKKNTAYVILFVIDKNMQRKGIGKKIFLELEQVLKEKGYKSIMLSVLKSNPAGEKFWSSIGFEKVLDRKTYIEMKKTIK